MPQNQRTTRGRRAASVPPIERLAQGLSSRYLLFALASLFVLDLFVIWDPIPFIDEIFLGLATILLARWQGRRNAQAAEPAGEAPKPPPKNVTPSGATVR